MIYGLGGLIQRIVAVLLLPLYTRYLTPSDYGAIEVLVALTAVVFALLRAGIQSSFFRFYFTRGGRAGTPDRRPHLLLVHDGHRDPRAGRRGDLRPPDLARALRLDRACESRPRRLRRALGDDELRPADRALPRRGALGELLGREPRQRPADGRRDDLPRRHARQGPGRGDRRQLRGDARDLPRAARLPPVAARVRVRPRRLSPDDRLGHAVHPVGDRPERDRLRRPLPAGEDEGPARARPLRDRDAGLGRAPLPARRLPHRLARVRVLDPRGRGQADVRLRPHLRDVLLLLGRARARARRAVDRAPADDAGVLRGLGGRPAARVRVRRSSARTSSS